MIKVTFEGHKSVGEIKREFENQLSPSQILSTTARAINDTSKRTQGYVRKEVKIIYTINKKYLDRMSYIRKYAKGDVSSLYSEVAFSYKPNPLIAFKHSGTKGQRLPITVEIKKGNSKTFRHAFIAAMRNTSKVGDVSEHEGIFEMGRYSGKKFVHELKSTTGNRPRITELRSVSAFTMSTSKDMSPKITKYVGKNLPARLHYFLQKKIDKLTRP